MTDRPLRRAGRTVLSDGALLVWSMAEGRHGRRWRAQATVEGNLTHVILLESGLDGRPVRLELTTPAGLLTLHAEPDGRSIHGNVVSARGVRPLAFAWSADHELEVRGRPIATAVMLRRLARAVPVGEGETVPVLAIDQELEVRPATRLVRRLTEGRWEVADLAAGQVFELEIDPDGLVQLDDHGEGWPLEA
jgi:hypothetical protein